MAEEAKRKEHSEIPLPEWLAAALGFVVVAVLVGFQAWKALQPGDAPPILEFQVKEVHDQQGRYLVKVEVNNRGDLAAAGLTLDATLYRGSQALERAQAQLDYAPAHSQRDIGVFFRHDPRQGRLEFMPVSYQEP